MIAGLLLAAGGARRFGSQKLVAKVGGVPIVRRAAEALASGVDELVVVTGSDGVVVRDALAGLNLRCVENAEWAAGLSTSLRAGILALDGEASAAVIALGDQPGLDPELVRTVTDTWRATGKPIVAVRYHGARGHPVLLDRAVFGEASEVRGDMGARMLIERDATRVAYVDVEADAPRDVDTPVDLEGMSS
ncbi:MAG TPA: nucleotidyltransferase family protein [Gemmatimonadaceae bacterium]|nr:nucleotidyltransferase family protein [Gemmatimonadaceae bacterium]